MSTHRMAALLSALSLGVAIKDAAGDLPPLTILCQRFLALNPAERPHSAARIAAFNAKLKGRSVEGWDGWVARVDCQGAWCTVSAYGEAPYGSVSSVPLTPVLIPLTDAGSLPAPGFDPLLSLGGGVERYPYLTAAGVPAFQAHSLRPGQRVGITATLVEIRYGTGIEITLSGAQLAVAPRPPPDPFLDAAGIVEITLRRDPCVASCRGYELSVDGDGGVTWRHSPAPSKPKVPIAQLTAQQKSALLDAFLYADFFSLADDYLRPDSSEQPSVVVSFRLGNRRKTIRHSFSDLTAPVRLAFLEDRIDEIVGTKRWLAAAER